MEIIFPEPILDYFFCALSFKSTCFSDFQYFKLISETLCRSPANLNKKQADIHAMEVISNIEILFFKYEYYFAHRHIRI